MGHFGSKSSNLTTRGVYKCGRSVLLLDSFHPYSVRARLEWFLGMFRLRQGVKIVKSAFSAFFRQNFGVQPPQGVQRKGYPLGYLYFFKKILHIFQE